jgi:hypothetical protein
MLCQEIPAAAGLGNGCQYIIVDTLVRQVPDMNAAKWHRYPHVEIIPPEMLGALRRRGSKVIRDSIRTIPGQIHDSTFVVIARLPPSEGDSVVYAALTYSPYWHHSIWTVTLKRSIDGWLVTGVYLEMQN